MLKILSLIFLFHIYCYSQDSDTLDIFYPLRVDSVEITGNEITENDIILRELTFKTGDNVSYEDLMYNRERVFSLGIFNRVDFYTSKDDSLNIVVIDVEESWYIYPIPFVEIKERNWNKLSYGFDIFVKNFRGRNESIRLRSAFGYDPSFYLNYTIPSLTDDGNYYLFTELNYRDISNKSKYAASLLGYNFNQNFISGFVGIGRRFGIFHRVSINTGYSYIENPVYVPEISASNDRIDRFPQAGLNYIYDTRDLAQFPREGIYFNTAVTFKGLGINNINYQILNLDFREYRNIVGDLAGKWRLSGRWGFGGRIPTYDFSYIGFGERIRGFYKEEMEGHHFYLASAELYYPLFNDVRVNLDFVPLLPKELLHYRAGLFLQFFTDTGTTKLRYQTLNMSDFVTGYGTGLTLLILPYNILRVEFAISENGETEWILDLGISF